jgi:hypothetical protein
MRQVVHRLPYHRNLPIFIIPDFQILIMSCSEPDWRGDLGVRLNAKIIYHNFINKQANKPMYCGMVYKESGYGGEYIVGMGERRGNLWGKQSPLRAILHTSCLGVRTTLV